MLARDPELSAVLRNRIQYLVPACDPAAHYSSSSGVSPMGMYAITLQCCGAISNF